MNVFEKFINLGLGTFSMTKEKAEKLIDEMVERGELNREEAKKNVEELIKKGEEQRDNFRSMMREEMDKWKKDSGHASKEEIERLEARIKELEDKLNQAGQG